MSNTFQSWLKTKKRRVVGTLTDEEVLRYADEYADEKAGIELLPEREMVAMQVLIKRMVENGCSISEENVGYSYFIKGAGFTKDMGLNGVIRHLVKAEDLLEVRDEA